jgi:hypothetical protein|tara:strand:- start:387 stop:1196 length:810 start_codon:yes stop_codon:yes gene_type:complete
MKNSLVILLLLVSTSLVAQIETDRPDFTESPNVVPKGALQVETGFILENDKQSLIGLGVLNNLSERNITVNTTLLRYGLTNNIELRFNTSFNNNGEIFNSAFTGGQDFTSDRVGFSSSFIGFKTNLYKNDKISIGFLGHLYIPELTSGDFAKASGQKIAPEFLVPLTYDITSRFGIAIQYGLSWDGFTPSPTTSYTLALGYGITEKLSFYIEPYGFLTNSGEELHLINGGFTYLINDDFQIDLTGGFGLNEAAPDNFVNCGASFLLFNK